MIFFWIIGLSSGFTSWTCPIFCASSTCPTAPRIGSTGAGIRLKGTRSNTTKHSLLYEKRVSCTVMYCTRYQPTHTKIFCVRVTRVHRRLCVPRTFLRSSASAPLCNHSPAPAHTFSRQRGVPHVESAAPFGDDQPPPRRSGTGAPRGGAGSTLHQIYPNKFILKRFGPVDVQNIRKT